LRYRNLRTLSFTRRQSEQLRNTQATLRKLNRSALDQLRRIGYSAFTYSEAAKSLAVVATLMNSVLQVREQIISDASEQGPRLIQVVLGTYCESCNNKPHPLNEPDDHQADFAEPLKQDPAWWAEIDGMLELAPRKAELLFARRMAQGTLPRALSTALNRLTNALLRQRRHLQELVPKQEAKIEVLEEFGTCTVCGKPPALSAEKEDPDRV